MVHSIMYSEMHKVSMELTHVQLEPTCPHLVALFVTLSRFNPKKRFVSARHEWVKSKSKLHTTEA